MDDRNKAIREAADTRAKRVWGLLEIIDPAGALETEREMRETRPELEAVFRELSQEDMGILLKAMYEGWRSWRRSCVRR